METRQMRHQKKNKDRPGRVLSGKALRFLIILFCLFLCLFLITEIDQSTKAMIQANDDQHAFGLYLSDEGTVQLELVGITMDIDTKEMQKILEESSRFVRQMVEGMIKRIKGMAGQA